MARDLQALKADRNLWYGFLRWSYPRELRHSPKLAQAAFEAIEYWHGKPTSKRDERQGGAIDGALTAIDVFISYNPDTAYQACRRVGGYFASPNINSAFGAIRRFEYRGFSRYTIFVADQLIAVATWDNPTPSPVEMTLRGIAFRSLFKLDPQYKYWPQLRRARDECVHGLLTWQGKDERSQLLAAQITRYL